MKNNFWVYRTMDDAYCIGYRKYNQNSELLLCKNYSEKFKVIKPSFRYWYADPIVNTIKENDYLYCEMYDRIKNKGCIGISYWKKNGKLSRPIKILEVKDHLSFPVVFEWKEQYYMWPCIGGKEINIFRMGKDEKTWELWYAGNTREMLVDVVIEKKDNRIFAITSDKENKNSYLSTRAVYELCGLETSAGFKLKKIFQAKEVNRNDIRNGGKILKFGEKLCSVTQESNEKDGYGVNILFHQIEGNVWEDYHEDMVSKIKGEDIHTEIDENRRYVVKGLHTYSVSTLQKTEIIDIKVRAFSVIFIYRYIRDNFRLLMNRLLLKGENK